MLVNDGEESSGTFLMGSDKENIDQQSRVENFDFTQQSNGSLGENGVLQQKTLVDSIILTVPSRNESTIFSSKNKDQQKHVKHFDFPGDSPGENVLLQEQTFLDLNVSTNPSVYSPALLPLTIADSTFSKQSLNLSKQISSGYTIASSSVSARPQHLDFTPDSLGKTVPLQEDPFSDFNVLTNPSVNSPSLLPLSTRDSTSKRSLSLSKSISAGPSLASDSVSPRPHKSSVSTKSTFFNQARPVPVPVSMFSKEINQHQH
ncbi:uncharacterized protein LOC127286891 [Leptopilina boulardi]|uniref:uncharacterized protein LOC127286891 n=1 Tax=Leptopilina boulardi TaxID=63433 RepID=UPI0021F5954A|nr:uncharacterized protein LOC127286891 [Leptopilina boulardi]